MDEAAWSARRHVYPGGPVAGFPRRLVVSPSIWELANDPDKLHEYGIRAIYGSAVYQPLKEGLIYVFKISPTGQFYPETVPDM